MNSLRHLLLVVVLLFAQLAAGAHAIEHASTREGTLPNHVCELCLAAQDLGSALPSLVAMPPLASVYLLPEAVADQARSAFPPPAAPQRGPPLA